MELKGEYRIPASREHVWTLLNDPETLRACIPGCESLERTGDNGFAARVTTKIGPVKATFTGEVAITDMVPPESYRISGEGKGGVAGFASGGANVRLAPDGEGTLLAYTADAKVGGKLAQLGGRLIDSTAKKLADQFFACFAERAGAPASSGAATTPAAAEPLGAEQVTAPLIMPGQPIPPAATGVPIVDGQAARPETVPPLGSGMAEPPRVEMTPLHHAGGPIAPGPATVETNAPGASIQSLAREAEQEVEREAAMGFLGGPMVWGLLVILALLFVYVIAS